MLVVAGLALTSTAESYTLFLIALVALTMLVGFYVSTAIFIKALAIPDDNA